MPDERTEYTFTPPERLFFERQHQQMQAMVNAMNNALSLLISQQSLPGQWRFKQDMSGIERMDNSAQPVIVQPPPNEPQQVH